jgi:hypothetical protein
MNTSLNAALADAHICELRRQACRTRLAGSARAGRRSRRAFLGRHRSADNG